MPARKVKKTTKQLRKAQKIIATKTLVKKFEPPDPC